MADAYSVREKIKRDYAHHQRRTLEELLLLAAALWQDETPPQRFVATVQAQLRAAAVPAYLAGKRLATGVPSTLDASDQATIENYLTRQQAFLQGFANDLQYNPAYDPKTDAGKARTEWRASLYAKSLDGIANWGFLRGDPSARVRWIRHVLDSCDTCIWEAGQGTRFAYQMTRVPGDGTTICRANCKCTLMILLRGGKPDIPGPA